MTTIHKAAAMVITDDTFLMVRKVGKDMWTNLGGHVEAGETAEQAVVREVKEELNCDATIVRKLGDFRATAAIDGGDLLLSTFLVELSGTPEISDPELEKFGFIGRDYREQQIKLPESITDHVLPYCKNEGLLSWS